MRSNGSALLLAHLQSGQTTTCRLLKITTPAGDVFGLTSLDVAIDYDDGTGNVTYVATKGFDPTAFRASTGYAVDNAEAVSLISDEIGEITAEMVNAGELDDSAWVCMLINYRDTSMGHMVLGFGDIGEVKMRWGMMYIPELLDLMARLKQPLGTVDSIRCRATFGAEATEAEGQNGCGVDLTSLWIPGSVTSVGSESNRVFIGTAEEATIAGFFPGVVRFTTGPNIGLDYSVESFEVDVVTLAETTRYPIEIGDEYEIRPDCGKRYLEDCISVWDNGLNFKGEPYIPTGDAAQIQSPLAQVARTIVQRITED